MSLINDALRQASQAHREQAALAAPPLLAQPLPALEPVSPAPISPWPSLLLMAGVVLLGLGLAGTGGFLAWRTWHNRRIQLTLNGSTPSQARQPGPTPKSAPAKASVPDKTPVVTVTPTAAAVSTPAASPVTPVTALPANPTNVTARVVAPVKWPPLRLQGIFYKPPNSAVLINSKMLYVEDEVQGAKVAEIGRTTVKLLLEGQTNTLVLR
jgi:hypothetical protein